MSYAFSLKGGRYVLLVGMLDLAVVLDFPASVEGQLALSWCGLVKSNKKVRDVIFHGQATSSVRMIGSVVPLQADA